MSKVDILVNVRQDYRGETSLTTLEAMRYGVVTIVKKVGWYDEIPDAAACKVADNNQVENVLEVLLNDTEYRQGVSHAAVDLVEAEFTHDSYAVTMFNLIEKN